METIHYQERTRPLFRASTAQYAHIPLLVTVFSTNCVQISDTYFIRFYNT